MRAWAVAGVLVGLAWAGRGAAQPDDAAAVRRAIEALNAKYSAAFVKKDVPALMEMYTDDATMLNDGKAVRGKKARETILRDSVEGIAKMELDTLEVDARGDLAYEIGSCTTTARDDGAKTTGAYLIVWKKQGGTWRIHAESFVPANPPAPLPPAPAGRLDGLRR